MKLIHIAFIPLMFAHWLGWQISLVYICCLAVILLITKLSRQQLFLKKDILGILLFSIVFIVFNSSYFVKTSNIGIVYLYLYQYISLFGCVAIVVYAEPWTMAEIYKIARIIFWIAFYSIAIEFVAVNFLGVSKEFMPAVRHSHSYFADVMDWHRPFGLTGQTSANGGILLLAFLLLLEIRDIDVKKVMALLIGTVMTISGQAILTNCFVIILIIYRKISSQICQMVFIVFSIGVLFFILHLELFQKISLDYLVDVLWYKSNVCVLWEHMDAWQILMGTFDLAPNLKNYGSEVYLITSIKLFGIVFTILLWSFVWFLVKNSRLKFIWFTGAFLSSLHYPTIFYIEAQLPLAILYVATLKSRQFYFPQQKNICYPPRINVKKVSHELKDKYLPFIR